ncbi:MAG: hypothetical protein GX811_04310, partial [Lentisphaerae bacterium]|nr:hypothetical protein [Lentisphaerota bacterium]
GGVRWGIKSEFLEDVFTTNDYAYTPGGKAINDPPVTPYLITEFAGCLANVWQISTTQTHIEYAMLHARIMDAICGHEKVSGGIGWCAFDYHSQDWLTTDGIQPWGLMDPFRAPKLAAGIYASQVDPSVRPVLQAMTRWKVGDQAGFDPNETVMKEGHDSPLVVFSNCDRIEVKIGGKLCGSFEPDRKVFPHLKYPPFFCTNLGHIWGPSWLDLQITGYLGKKRVIEHKFPASQEANVLEMTIDDKELIADGSDMTRILLRHTDEYGNQQPHSRLAVTLELHGPGTLIGPNPCALVGGVAGLYLRAGKEVGTVTVTARAPSMQTRQTVKIKIKKEKRKASF